MADDYDGYLEGTGSPLDWPFPSPRGPVQPALWLGLLVLALVVLVAAALVRRRHDGSTWLLAVALFCVGLLPQALQRPDSTHLAWASCVPFAVVPVAIVELLPVALRVRRPTLAALGAVATPLVVMFLLVPFFTWRDYADATVQSLGRRRVEGTIRHGERTFRLQRHDAVEAVNAMLPVVDEISEPGDRLFVGPGDLRRTPYSEAFLYHLLPELEPATRYIEMDPGVANATDSGMADELASADIVILSTIRDGWVEPNDSAEPGPDEPNRVLARDFCLVARFGEGPFDPSRGLYELYRRC
jgi:hypothetical protein